MPEHVARAVQRVATMQLAVLAQRVLGLLLQDAQFEETLSQHRHGGVVGIHELGAGTNGGDPRALGFVDEVVDATLGGRERAVDRHGPSDVGGVELVALDARVEQQEIAARGRHRCCAPSAGSSRAVHSPRSSRSRCRFPRRGREG